MTRAGPSRTIARLAALVGGAVFVASLLYFAACYAWGFGERPPLEAESPVGVPVLVNIGLFSVFALHHSLFARPRVKRWIGEVFGPDLERSVYVWIASLLFIVVCAAWMPVPGQIWRVEGPLAVGFAAVQVAAGVLTVLGARRLDVLELAGIRQLFPQEGQRPLALLDDGLYGLVRHPIYLGWLLLVWPAADMNGTRFLFAAVSTAYLVAAVPWEERALAGTFGATYDEYKRRVRWRMLPGVY
jgi:protein-S-isoprenylcysteine O-methyltransferase Ste14